MSSPNNRRGGSTESPAGDFQAGEAVDPPADESLWPAILARIGELHEYAVYYIVANVDRLKLAGRTTLMWVALGALLSLVFISVVVAASAMVVVGLAGGVGELFGERRWLGQLIVGAAVLLASLGFAWLGLYRSLRHYEQSLVEKYEFRKKEERAEFGTDVEQRARERSQSA